ncbi:MAG: hypothetical protein HYR66_11500 [Sphingobacteriales bacterium]|nr:hypothetical protein [Sphingobacteriales bacterium]MBI3720496.1 hypothetical protein [Sphingobacteriales bacterium]
MKKLSAILLLCVYFLTQIGAVAWYYYKPIAHTYFSRLQREIFNADRNEATILTFDKEKFQQLKNDDDEIVINGVLYDVEDIISNGNKVIVTLQKDKAETDWTDHYQKLTSHLDKNSKSKTPHTGKAAPTFISLYQSRETKQDFVFDITTQHKYSAYLNTCYNAPVIGLLSPPPKVA